MQYIYLYIYIYAKLLYITTAIGMFGLSTFSFAISYLLICGVIWLYERRPGNTVDRVSRLAGSVPDQNMDEELRLSLSTQETSS